MKNIEKCFDVFGIFSQLGACNVSHNGRIIYAVFLFVHFKSGREVQSSSTRRFVSVLGLTARAHIQQAALWVPRVVITRRFSPSAAALDNGLL